MVRSMMSLTELPDSFWGFALQTAALTLNNSPTKAAEKTPYELWKGRTPNLSYMKIWGCEAYVKSKSADKLAPRSEKCYFVGYPKTSRGYYFYNKHENIVYSSRDAVFLEKEFVSKRQSGRKFDLDEVKEPSLDVESQNTLTESITLNFTPWVSTLIPRRSGRPSHPPDIYILV